MTTEERSKNRRKVIDLDLAVKMKIDGKSNKEIAETIGAKEITVHKQIYERMNDFKLRQGLK